MIGRHSVSVSADRSGSPWSAALNFNPYLDASATGWVIAPGTAVWADGRVAPVNSMDQVGASATADLVVGARYRIRAVFATDARTLVAINLHFFNAAGAKVLDQVVGSQTYDPGSWAWTIEFVPRSVPVGTTVAKIAPSVYRVAQGANPSLASVSSLELSRLVDTAPPIDLSCLVDDVSIHHGRDDVSQQPDAPTATIVGSYDNRDETMPTQVEIGATVTVSTRYPDATDGFDYTRFRGRITDVEMTWPDADSDTPYLVEFQVIAAGFSADLGRRVVGDAPFPQELDGARVSRVLSLAGVVLDPFTSDPGTVQVLPRDVDSQPALDVAQETAGSALGIVWETKDGSIRYADAEHRRNSVPLIELDSCEILVAPVWNRDTDQLINKASIGYGPTPDEGEQPRYIVQSDSSIATYGLYFYTATTELARLADAQALGSMIVGRNNEPVWVMSDLPVDVAGLDAGDTQRVLELEMHDLVSVTALPAAGSAPTTAALFVEGWDEKLAWGIHELQLHVSGFCRSSPPPRWDDVDPAWSWDTISPSSLTWDGVSCLGPNTSTGRWNDVSASLRWNSVAPSITWNTWKG